MKGQSPTGRFFGGSIYSTFYFCAIAVHWTCSEVRMLMELKRNLKTSYILDNLAIARHYYYEKLHTFRD